MIEASLWETAIELQSYLESCSFSFCIIGGIAIQRWGEPRLTRDVDATLAIPFGSERRVAGEILKRYQSRISNRPQDWVDIQRLIVRQGKKLKRDLILEELKPLVELKEEPEILDNLNQLLTSTN